MSTKVVDRILTLYSSCGDVQYHGEPVSVSAHSLQAAALARMVGAAPALVVAALLHDIGHLLHGDEALVTRGIDGRHEEAGARFLEREFPIAVVEPVRLHVAAKRALAIDPSYRESLSDESQRSLVLQGGVYSDGEAAAFRRRPFAEDALRLRSWDDTAKIAGLEVPTIDAYRDAILVVIR